MTAQAALIADTIAGMKRAIARYQNSSDSDEPYLQPSNRGNKLKRKSHYIHDGQAGRANGPKIYKRSIEHAGFHRNILQRNPKRYDEDGDELEDDDVDEEADARAADENPYAEIRLEDLLLPLVSAASLPNHPSLSVAYTSPTLTNMAQHACEMMQKERKTLASAKGLTTKLRGDGTWLPCGLFYSERDEAMFNTEKLYADVRPNGLSRSSNEFVAQAAVTGIVKGDAELASRKSSTSATELGSSNDTTNGTHQELVAVVGVDEKAIANGGVPLEAAPHEDLQGMVNRRVQEEHVVELGETSVPQDVGSEETTKHQEADLDHEMVDIVGPEISSTGKPQSENAMQRESETSHINGETANGGASTDPAQGGARIEGDPASSRGTEIAPTNHLPTPDMEIVGEEQAIEAVEGEDAAQPVARRMRTRAQAQAASEPTASSRNESPESWVPPDIHRLFIIPEKAMPDKDFGLPADEAAETRRMLTMYVQKQEEVCRGAERLYEGLLKVDRQRKMVLEWCKAEGHVGEMSDGEDWYDKEEWGLEEDLKKGHNDEDEDNAVPGKKTRGRRA